MKKRYIKPKAKLLPVISESLLVAISIRTMSAPTETKTMTEEYEDIKQQGTLLGDGPYHYSPVQPQ